MVKISKKLAQNRIWTLKTIKFPIKIQKMTLVFCKTNLIENLKKHNTEYKTRPRNVNARTSYKTSSLLFWGGVYSTFLIFQSIYKFKVPATAPKYFKQLKNLKTFSKKIS